MSLLNILILILLVVWLPCSISVLVMFIAFSIKESNRQKNKIDSAYVRMIELILNLYNQDSYEEMLDCYFTLFSNLSFKRQCRLIKRFPVLKEHTSIEEQEIDLNATPYHDISKIGGNNESAD